VGSEPQDIPGPLTGRIGEGTTGELSEAWPEVTYRPIPHGDRAGDDEERPVWRLRFDVLGEDRESFGLDVNDEIVFGRGRGRDLVDLTPFGAERLGVSRRQMLLRPTPTQLFVMDLGSTNGTMLNGYSTGVNTPYSIANGDILTLGALHLMINVISRPKGMTGMLHAKANLGDALTEMVKAIASKLEIDEALSQVVEGAMSLTGANETAIWLLDKETGELFLEAERGIGDEKIRRVRIPVSDKLVYQVIETGEPLRANRAPDGAMIEVRTGYQVEALVYVPIALGGVTFGVLAGAHHQSGKTFSPHDQRVLETIADFAAIAVHNTRLYRAAGRAAAQRVAELTAINEVSRAVSASLDPTRVYAMLTRQVQEHWQVEGVSLWIMDPNTDTVSLVSDSWGKQARQGTAAAKNTEMLVNAVADSGEPLLLSDAIRSNPHLSVDDTHEIRSELAVPIKLQDRILGVLNLQSPQFNRFSQTDIQTLQTVADQLAVTIENAQLYKQVESHANRLEELVEQRTSEYDTASEHLQTLSRLKDEFVANVSHELRSPITNLKLLHSVIRNAPPRKRDRYLDAMERETGRLEQIVDDLLRLSRMEEDGIALRVTPVDLNALCDRYVSDRTALAESRGLTLTLSQHPDLPPIPADEGLLGQVLSILLTNALNYTPSGEWVEVSTQVQSVEGQRWVGFSVSDSGFGILPDEKPLLFERFFRGKVGRESGRSGTGLGLSIAKEIMEQHDGRIEVESEGTPGDGATFSIWLPLTGLDQATLLLVDDDETMLEVMNEILVAAGYEVQAAKSGDAALAVLQAADEASRPALIVTDVVMPHMTGLQLLEEVRNHSEWAGIPFLFISASTTLAMEGQIAGLDNVAFLRKPFDSQGLQETVAGVLADNANATIDENGAE
jgi:signal transduction histidine kinase/ActR/RegA family two-component response regulator